jgi:hypothetical protein
MKHGSIRKAAYLVVGLGVVLHVYLAVGHALQPDFKLHLMPLMGILPYAMCLVLLKYFRSPVPALCTALLLLTADLFLFRNFIVDSSGAGYNLISIYTPVWKLALLVPLGCFIGRMIDNVVTSRGNKK